MKYDDDDDDDNGDDDFQDENLFPDTFNDKFDDEDEISEEEYVDMLERKDFLEEKSLELKELALKQKLLIQVMKFVKNYPYWKYKSKVTKLKIIKETYNSLNDLLKENKKD